MIGWLGIPLVVRAGEIDESQQQGEPPDAYLKRVTLAKLQAVQSLELGDAWGVLVADTIVVAPDGGLLGKPRDARDACTMIERLAGATHEVSTRFALAELSGATATHAQTVTT